MSVIVDDYDVSVTVRVCGPCAVFIGATARNSSKYIESSDGAVEFEEPFRRLSGSIPISIPTAIAARALRTLCMPGTRMLNCRTRDLNTRP